MKKLVLALLPLFVLSGCERSIPDLSVNSGGRIVELWCGLPSVTAGVSSRAADLTGQVGNTNAMNLYFARRDKGGMTTSGGYPVYGSEILLATREASSGSASAKVVFDEAQYYAMYSPYLTSTFKYNPTKLVGWFPMGDYNNGVVSIPMDGNTDILLSNEVEGSYDKPFNEANKLTFSHVCTLNEIKVKAVDAGAPDSWGAVTRVALNYCGGRVCEITLPDQVWFPSNTPGTSLDSPLELIGGPTASSPVTLVNGVAKSCGTAMVYPESTRDLIVTTEKGGERKIAVTNGTEGFQAGKSYVITLEFKSVTIEPSVTISEWTPSTNNPSVDL